MSVNNVDERIVEMRFDNRKFEEGAKQTLNTLEKLERALHLDPDTSGIEKLQKSFAGFDTSGVERLQKSFAGFDASPMANAIDSVQAHFTALEVAGMRVISNLTDSVYHFTANMVKGFTIDPITAGFGKFGDKTTAVSTLLAQGYELDKVNDLMEQLNWFTDETSYNFIEMVENIGKFTATGQDLEASVDAMEGIALWAAMSGQNATRASMAMRQLSQAMTRGVKFEDWKSIQNYSMDTVQFREQVVAAAEALGTLKKVGDDTWVTLTDNAKAEEKLQAAYEKWDDAKKDRDRLTLKQEERLSEARRKGAEITRSTMLDMEDAAKNAEDRVTKAYEAYQEAQAAISKGMTLSELFTSEGLNESLWFSPDVAVKVWGNYSKAVNEIRRFQEENDIDNATDAIDALKEKAEGLAESLGVTLDEAFQKLGYDIDEFSLKAFEAGQKARTWTDVVSSIKDAVSTGWMHTFEAIIGTAEDATAFWSNLAEKFWDIFASGGERRNKIFEIGFGLGVPPEEEKQTTGAVENITSGWTRFEERIKSSGRTMGDFEKSCRNVIDAASGTGTLNNIVDTYGSLEEAFVKGAISAETFHAILEDLSATTEDTVVSVSEGTKDTAASLEELKEVARGVIRGDYGNGQARREMLEAMGYNYKLVQGIAEIMYNGGQGMVGVTEHLLQTEYPTFYAMLQDYGISTEEVIATLNDTLGDSDSILEDIQTNVVKLTGNVKEDVKTIRGSKLFEDSIDNIFGAFISTQETFRAAVDDTFGTLEDRGRRLYGFLERLKAATDRIGLSDDAQKGLQKIFDVFLGAGKIALDIAGGIVNVLGRMTLAVKDFIDKGLSAIGNSKWDPTKLLETWSGWMQRILPYGDKAVSIFTGLLNPLGDVVSLLGLASGGILHGVFVGLGDIFGVLSSGAVEFYNYVTGLESVQGLMSSVTDRFGKFSDKLSQVTASVRAGFKKDGFSGALENLFETVKTGTEVHFPKLYEFLGKLGGRFGELGDKISGLYTKIVSNFSFDNLLNSVIGFVSSIPDMLSLGFEGVGVLFETAFGGIYSFLSSLIDNVNGIDFSFSGLSDGLQQLYGIVTQAYNSVFGDPTELKTKVTDFVLNVWDAFVKAIQSITISDALKAFRTAIVFTIGERILSLIKTYKEIGKTIKTIPEAITKAFNSLGNMFEGIGSSFRANAIIKFAVAVGMIAVAIAALSRVPEDQLTHAATVVGVLMIVLTMLANSIQNSSVKKLYNAGVSIRRYSIKLIDTLPATLIGLGVMIASIGSALFKLSNIEDTERLRNAVIAVLAIFVVIGLLALGLMGILKSMQKANPDNLQAGAVAYGNSLLKLGGAITLISGAVTGLIVPILVFTAALGVLKKLDLSEGYLAQGAVIVGAALVLFGAVVYAISKALSKCDDKQIKEIGSALLKSAAAMLLMALAVGAIASPIIALAAAFALLEWLEYGDKNFLWRAAGILGAVFLSLSLIVAACLYWLTKKDMNPVRLKAIGQTVMKIAGAIDLLALAMNMMVLPILSLTAAMVLMEQKFQIKDSWVKILESAGILVGAIVVLGGALTTFAHFNVNGTKMVLLASGILILSAAMLVLVPAISALAVVIAGLAYLVKDIENFEVGLERMTSVMWIAVGFSASIALLGVALAGFGIATGGAAIGVLALSVAIIAIALAFDKLVDISDKISEWVGKFNDWLTVDNIWKYTKVAAAIAGITVVVLALSKAIKNFGIGLRMASLGESLSNTFGSLLSGVPGKLNSAIKYFGDHIGEYLPALAGLAVVFGLYMTGLIPDWVHEIFNVLVAFLDSLADEVERNSDPIYESLTRIVNSIIKMLGKVFNDNFSLEKIVGSENWWEALLRGTGAFKLGSAILNLVVPFSKIASQWIGKIPGLGGAGSSSAASGVGKVGVQNVDLQIVKAQASGSDADDIVDKLNDSPLGSKLQDMASEISFPIGWALAGVGAVIFGIASAVEKHQDVQDKSNEIAENILKETHSEADRIEKLAETLTDNSYFNAEVLADPNSEAARAATERWQARGVVAESLMHAIALDEGVANYLSALDWYAINQKYIAGNRELSPDDILNFVTDIRQAAADNKQFLAESLSAMYSLNEADAQWVVSHITFKNSADETADRLQERLAFVANSYGTTINEVIQWSRDTGKSIDDVLSVIERTGTDLASMTFEGFADEYEKMQQEQVKAASAEAVSGARDILGALGKEMKTVAEASAKTEIKDDLVNIGNGLINDVITDPKLREQLDTSLKNAGFEGGIKDAILKAFTGTEEEKAKAGDAVKEFFKDVYNSPETSAKVKEIIDNSGIREDGANAIQALMGSGFSEGLTSLIGEDASEYTDEIRELLTTILDPNASKGDIVSQLKSMFSEAVGDTGLQNKLTSLFGNDGLAGYALSGMANTFLDPNNSAVSAMDILGDNVWNTLATNWLVNSPSKRFAELAFYCLEGLRVGFEDRTGRNGVTNALEDFIDQMESSFDDTQEDYRGFALDAANGLVIGISEKLTDAYNSGVDLANAFSAGFTETLQINSPSRVFRRLASFIPDGAAIGINDETPIAIQSVVGLGDALIAAMAKSMARVGVTADESFDFTPHVVPVVDFSNAASQLTQIDSMTNSRQMSAILQTSNGIGNFDLGNLLASNQNTPVTSAIDGLSKKMDSFTKSLDQDRNFNVDIRVDQMAVRDESDIRAISKQLAKEVRVALRQKGKR